MNHNERVISVADTGAVAGVEALQTEAFQKALDDIFLAGGGTVTVPAGDYWIGAVRIRSNTTLHLQSGARLFGSRDPEDYYVLQNDQLQPLPEEYRDHMPPPTVRGQHHQPLSSDPGGRRFNALFRVFDAENISIVCDEGSAIDGNDVYDDLGEEGYRGPIGFSMYFVRNVTFLGMSLYNTGNWAVYIKEGANITFDRVRIYGGHDGIDVFGCENVLIRNSAFYTGDDCIAGFGNVNVMIHDCILNSSCSAMRFGGTNVFARDCHCYGPGEYCFRNSLTLEEKIHGIDPHREHRHNMLAMFTYFAMEDRVIKEIPDNIVIRNFTVENADRFIHYNFSGNERWQGGPPMRGLTMENIKAKGVLMPLTLYGRADCPLNLTLRNIEIDFRPTDEPHAFMHIAHCESLVLENLKIGKSAQGGFIKSWSPLGRVHFADVDCPNDTKELIEYTDEPFVCKRI